MADIINYITDDFVMTAACHQTDKLYQKASTRIKDIEKATQYRASGVTGQVRLWSPGQKELSPVNWGVETRPVFFENADYLFEITFNEPVERPRVYSRLKEVSDKFNPKAKLSKQTLTGVINFGNDIGACEFILLYIKEGIEKRVTFQFEVFPTKLDFKNDHRILIEEVEEEYSRMALDLLKKTHLGFRSSPGEGNDLTWWSIFESIFQELMQAMRFILDKPHSRLMSKVEFRKKEQLKMLNPRLEEELIRHRQNPGKLYAVNTKSLSYDTPENRFLKYVVTYAYRKYTSIQEYIKQNKKKVISKDFSEEMDETGRQLKKIVAHPFFKATGEFNGMSQESAVLQKKPGYSTVYRNWILLKRSVQLFEGIQRIELKNIADLYQFWCFLKMKNIVQSLLGKPPAHMELAKVQEENLLYSLKRGETSKVVFISETGDKIELYHDLTYDLKEDHFFSNRVFTEVQRPDITLRIIKNDLHDPYVFTYLYDVKYRVEPDGGKNGCDSPPIDAINQMHRYRDAIYHLDKQTGAKRKEVIGCYILFPGLGRVEAIRKSGYFTSIEDINIGGFPLLPDDRYQSASLLREHLEEIIRSDSPSLLRRVIPQKGLQYVDAAAVVLIRFTSGPEQVQYLRPDGSMIYLMPVLDEAGKLNDIDLSGKTRYLAPAHGSSIHRYYEIDTIEIRQAPEIYAYLSPLLAGKNDLYYVFNLSGERELNHAVEVIPGKTSVSLYVRLSDLKSVHSTGEFVR